MSINECTRLTLVTLALVATGYVTTSCSSHDTTGRRAGVQSEAMGGDGDEASEPQSTDWSKPLLHGVDASMSQVQGPNSGLPFKPLIPHLPVAPSSIQVTDPSSISPNLMALGLTYKLPAGTTGVTGDGTVAIVEAGTTMTEADLQRIIDGNAQSGRSFPLNFGGYHGVLSVGDVDGVAVGRIFLLHNDFTIDMTGPAISPTALNAVMSAVTGAPAPPLPVSATQEPVSTTH